MCRILIMLLGLSCSFLSLGTTFTVLNTNDSGAGSLRQIISNASSLDTIRFDSSLLLSGSNTINLSSEIAWNDKAITIFGLYNSTDTLYLSGMNTNRIFNVNLNSASLGEKFIKLDSLVFVKGKSLTEGGAVRIFDSDSICVFNCLFLGNSAFQGGGIYSNSENSASVLVILNSTFAENDGGGVFSISNTFGSIVKANNSKFSGNQSSSGGGIYSFSENSMSDINLVNVEMSNNSVTGSGGGLYSKSANSSPGTIYLEKCALSQNNADNGGGINCYRANLEIVDCLIDENYASWQGGGIHHSGGMNLSIKGSTIAANASVNFGAGVYSVGENVNIMSSTLSGNSANSVGGALFANSPIIKIVNSTITNNEAGYRGAGLHCGFHDNNSDIYIINSTISRNIAVIGGGICNYRNYQLNIKSSIIAFNGNQGMIDVGNGQSGGGPINIVSYGSNIFDVDPIGSITSDQKFATEMEVDLGPLQYNGGPTATIQPSGTSIALNMGDPFDLSDAQNGSIIGRRDCGASESGILNVYDFVKITDEILIYPNPTQGKIYLKSPNHLQALEVFDLYGKRLVRLEGNSSEVDFSKFESGVYSIKIVDQFGHLSSQKIIKE